MTKICTKTFELRSFSTPSLWYRIEIYYRGTLVDEFEKPTMVEAWDAFDNAGYRRG